MRKSLPLIRETSINFDIEDRVVILADDVLQAGRTIRAALDAITDFGRPAITRLAILIDRGKHEFPIAADYV
jgi:pyrimidine operon attenuation protein/uracil phosphoribosyltransferase